jgi:hypothetical protein
MARKKRSDAPLGFSDKLWQKLDTNWRDAIQQKSTEEMEKEIVSAVRHMANTSHDMKNDDKLIALQEELKDLKGAYTDAIGAAKAKIDFIIFLMNSRGIAVPDTNSDSDAA